MMLAQAPWWGDPVLTIVGTVIGLCVTAALSWIGFQLRGATKATDRAIDVLAKHLDDIKPELRMLRMAINNSTLQHEAAMEKAVDASLDQHEKTQSLVREQADRIVNKIESHK